jgi:hypothetical protein
MVTTTSSAWGEGSRQDQGKKYGLKLNICIIARCCLRKGGMGAAEIDRAPTNCAHSIDKRTVTKGVLELIRRARQTQAKKQQPSTSSSQPVPKPQALHVPSNILKFPLAHSLHSRPVYLTTNTIHESSKKELRRDGGTDAGAQLLVDV